MKSLQQRIKEGQDIQQAIDNMNNSYQKRESRVKKRIEKMLQTEHKYFITFTIAPEHYHLKYETILRKIKEALKNASAWVLNSDYGAKNERLHFHCVASFNQQLDYNIINSVYQYGCVNFKPIFKADEKALREYLLKTFNHGIKQTAGKTYFSRKKKKGR
jgi:hypothetical protein